MKHEFDNTATDAATDDISVFKILSPPFFDTAPYYLPKLKRYGPRVDVRTEPKIGRNKPCPCGSGKKFKKCCL